MIKTKILVAVFLLMIAVLSTALGESEMRFLQAEGTKIVDEDGNEVLLRGVNAGGWLVMESWMTLTNAPSQLEAFSVLDERFGRENREKLFDIYEENYFKESDFDNIKALGMNVVRLPFAWWNITGEDGTLLEDAFDRLDWFVGECAERNIYVILDLHAAPGSQNGNDHSGDITGAKLFDNEEYMARTQYVWIEIAKHFSGNPAVAAYDLLNEPGGKFNSTGVVQWEFFDRLYKAIREVDKKHIIMMESCWDPADLPSPERYGWENVVYQYHFYKWNADNDYQAQKLFTDVKMYNIAKSAHPVPSFVGEFTLFQSRDAWNYALKTYSDAGIGWTIWTYKVTGNSTWGLYNVYGNKVDIYNDSYEEIEAKWREQGTIRRNTELCQIVANTILGSNVTLQDEPDDKTDTPVMHLPVKSVQAMMGAAVREEEGIYRLTTKASLDPSYNFNAISYELQESCDLMAYTYITFFVMDLQGSNTHKVTLVDEEGKVKSVWVDIPSVFSEWTRINVPISMFSGIDLSRISEIRIGEWNSGDYLFDKLFLCMGMMDE